MRLERSSRMVEHVLLITTKRVVFGTTYPLNVVFELPLERMARVELPSGKRMLILWTWHSYPIWLSPTLLLQGDFGARPNSITERHGAQTCTLWPHAIPCNLLSMLCTLYPAPWTPWSNGVLNAALSCNVCPVACTL